MGVQHVGSFLVLWIPIILSHSRTSLIGQLACELFFRDKKWGENKSASTWEWVTVLKQRELGTNQRAAPPKLLWICRRDSLRLEWFTPTFQRKMSEIPRIADGGVAALDTPKNHKFPKQVLHKYQEQVSKFRDFHYLPFYDCHQIRDFLHPIHRNCIFLTINGSNYKSKSLVDFDYLSMKNSPWKIPLFGVPTVVQYRFLGWVGSGLSLQGWSTIV